MSARLEFFIAEQEFAGEPLHYCLSGLPNVWLLNGFTRQTDEYGEAFDIHDVESLHDAIAATVIEKVHPLTGHELRFLRKRLGLTQAELGARLRLSDQTVANYEKGRTDISGPADTMIRVMYLLHVLPPDAGRAFVDDLLHRVSEVMDAHDRTAIVPRGWTSWREHLLAA